MTSPANPNTTPEGWTKGPWTADFHHTSVSAGRTYGWIRGAGIVPIAGVTLGVEGCSQDEGRANAHLIAAAPDLYEALKAMLNPVNGNEVENARAALALARGPQHAG